MLNYEKELVHKILPNALFEGVISTHDDGWVFLMYHKGRWFAVRPSIHSEPDRLKAVSRKDAVIEMADLYLP